LTSYGLCLFSLFFIPPPKKHSSVYWYYISK
jgi:hypothetical protein